LHFVAAEARRSGQDFTRAAITSDAERIGRACDKGPGAAGCPADVGVGMDLVVGALETLAIAKTAASAEACTAVDTAAPIKPSLATTSAPAAAPASQ
jgi:hypothetical protein